MRRCDEAHAVGADEAHAARLRDRDQLVLQRAPLRIELAELRRHHDAGSNAGACAGVDRLTQKRCRHRNQGDIDRPGCLLDRAIGGAAENVARRIDEDQAAGEAVLDHVVNETAAKLAEVLGRADDRDRSRPHDARGIDTTQRVPESSTRSRAVVRVVVIAPTRRWECRLFL